MNKKGLEVSYMVSYWVGMTGKPHTIVEDLILPAAVDMAGTMLGEKARISDMTGDVLKQLLLRIQASEFYALHLDESTYLAQLLVHVRYVYGGSIIKEDILFCKPLETKTTREDIFKVLDSFVTSNGLWWSRGVGIWVHCSIHKRNAWQLERCFEHCRWK